MNDRVFYSWQSDSPGNTNRNFILQALETAIADIHKDDTTDVEPVIDRDTLGLAGSPDISHSIFEKIDAASVFVCDVSIIDPSDARPTPKPSLQNGKSISQSYSLQSSKAFTRPPEEYSSYTVNSSVRAG